MRLPIALAFMLIAQPARAERAWFPVTGEATAGGSFGKHSIGHGNLFLGYQHGYRFEGDESGAVFAVGPVFTQRWFEPRSVGCPSSDAYVDGSRAQPSNGCGTGYSIGLQLRAGLAWDLTDDHHHEVPDHLLYVGVTPLLFGSEPRLDLQDGNAHDHSLTGIRLALGWNFLAWSRFVMHLPFEKKDDAINLLIFPYAIISKLEVHYEHVALANAGSDDRFGIVSGFGF